MRTCLTPAAQVNPGERLYEYELVRANGECVRGTVYARGKRDARAQLLANYGARADISWISEVRS